MRVLVLEGEPGAAGEVERRLRAAGHEVVRCHEPGLPLFPCVGLSDGACPLDGPRVDVAVTVRGHVRPSPALTEDGAVCALRAGIPLVMAGRTVLNPFAPWAAADVREADVVEACEAVVAGRPD